MTILEIYQIIQNAESNQIELQKRATWSILSTTYSFILKKDGKCLDLDVSRYDGLTVPVSYRAKVFEQNETKAEHKYEMSISEDEFNLFKQIYQPEFSGFTIKDWIK